MAHVYILRSGSENFFKVGKTDNTVEGRRRQLATGNPHRLTEFDVIETEDASTCETYLKGILQSRRSLDSEAKEIFKITPEELASELCHAREFLPKFIPTQQEAERLSKERSTGILLKPGHGEWEIFRRIREIRETECRLKYEREGLENQLKRIIGKADGLEQIATWRSYEIKKFNEAEFKVAHTQLHEDFLRVLLQRRFCLQ